MSERDTSRVQAAMLPLAMSQLMSWSLLSLVVLTVLFIGGVAVNQYLLIYMATFALTALKLPATAALQASIFVGVFGALASFCGGWCADRFGRRAVDPRSIALVFVGASTVGLVTFRLIYRRQVAKDAAAALLPAAGSAVTP
jgi:MFS family permease